MKVEITEKFKVVTPDDGKVLWNGDVTSKCLYMPIDGDTSAWSEIDDSEEGDVSNEEVINELKEAING